mmetsp:Transcript_36568/g.84058  ORF Transcript_36568/g.84058 Transcript_36568/m.84058 type:complete len:229 (-) Transcript_36568:551-1237(-)
MIKVRSQPGRSSSPSKCFSNFVIINLSRSSTKVLFAPTSTGRKCLHLIARSCFNSRCPTSGCAAETSMDGVDCRLASPCTSRSKKPWRISSGAPLDLRGKLSKPSSPSASTSPRSPSFSTLSSFSGPSQRHFNASPLFASPSSSGSSPKLMPNNASSSFSACSKRFTTLGNLGTSTLGSAAGTSSAASSGAPVKGSSIHAFGSVTRSTCHRKTVALFAARGSARERLR